MNDLLDWLFGDEVAWHLKNIVKAQKRIDKLKALLPASAGPNETKAINDAIASSERDRKWHEDQLRRLFTRKP